MQSYWKDIPQGIAEQFFPGVLETESKLSKYFTNTELSQPSNLCFYYL